MKRIAIAVFRDPILATPLLLLLCPSCGEEGASLPIEEARSAISTRTNYLGRRPRAPPKPRYQAPPGEHTTWGVQNPRGRPRAPSPRWARRR